jgi:hypothetical protein
VRKALQTGRRSESWADKHGASVQANPCKPACRPCRTGREIACWCGPGVVPGKAGDAGRRNPEESPAHAPPSPVRLERDPSSTNRKHAADGRPDAVAARRRASHRRSPRTPWVRQLPGMVLAAERSIPRRQSQHKRHRLSSPADQRLARPLKPAPMDKLGPRTRRSLRAPTRQTGQARGQAGNGMPRSSD